MEFSEFTSIFMKMRQNQNMAMKRSLRTRSSPRFHRSIAKSEHYESVNPGFKRGLDGHCVTIFSAEIRPLLIDLGRISATILPNFGFAEIRPNPAEIMIFCIFAERKQNIPFLKMVVKCPPWPRSKPRFHRLTELTLN